MFLPCWFFDAKDDGAARAGNGSRWCDACPGKQAVPSTQCGPSPRQRGPEPLTQLPAPLASSQPLPAKVVGWYRESSEEWGQVFSFTVLSPWTSISSPRQRQHLSPGRAHTHTHTYTVPTHMLLSCPLPFLTLKPRVEIRSVTRQSLWQVAALGTSQGLLEDLVSKVCLHSCGLFVFALTCSALLGFWKEKRWLKEV